MKKPTNMQILLYLILAALAFEVVVLARQNHILKKRVFSGLARDGGSRKEITDGMSFAPITLTDLEKEEFTLSYDTPGKKTLVYFFSLTCPQCLRTIPQWRKLAAELKDEQSVNIIGVTKGEIDQVKQYADGYNLSYRIGVNAEADTTIRNSYGIKYVPTTVLVSASGTVITHVTGVLSDHTRQQIFNKVFANTAVQ